MYNGPIVFADEISFLDIWRAIRQTDLILLEHLLYVLKSEVRFWKGQEKTKGQKKIQIISRFLGWIRTGV